MNKLTLAAVMISMALVGSGCAAEPTEEEAQGETGSAILASDGQCIGQNAVLVSRHALQLRKAPSPNADSIRVVQPNEYLTPRGSLCSRNGFLLATDNGGNTGWVWMEYVDLYYVQ